MATRHSVKPATNKKAGRIAKPADSPRRPGRPSGKAANADQRSRLLDIAIAMFAQRSIADTTLAAIAREASVTPATVHYYFKTRDQLLDVLIDERFREPFQAIGGVFEANADDPIKAVTQLALRVIDVATEYPWFPPLWMREIVGENSVLRKRMQERFGDKHRRSIYECITRWQREGRLNRDLEPSLIFLSILGLTILPLAAAKTWRNDPLRSQLGAADVARHTVALLQHGVGPQPAARKPAKATR